MPRTNTITEQILRVVAKACTFETIKRDAIKLFATTSSRFNPKTRGAITAVASTEAAIANPLGTAKRTTRFKKPGMYLRVLGAKASKNAGIPIVKEPI